MTYQPYKIIGPYRAGEKPEPLGVQFVDAAGADLQTTGWTAKAELRHWGELPVEFSASVNDTGRADVVLPVLTDPGDYDLEVWIGNGSSEKLASKRYRFLVQTALKVPTV